MTDEPKESANLGYALGQLAKALASTGPRAAERVAQWSRVIAGMASGVLSIGSRTPVAGTPLWVTLEVVHGGFATGGFATGGPLQPHETAACAALGVEPSRAALNLHYLSDAGRTELRELLQTGKYRVTVPEEAALLVVTWLIERDEPERAAALIDTIMPFFDRLRFYPVPHARPIRPGTDVSVQNVADSKRSLQSLRAQLQVERMNEALSVWTPLYDRTVGLFLETVEGAVPAFAHSDGPAGRSVEGGWPCRRFASDWDVRARQLLADYERARSQHSLCGKAENKKENFARLRGYLAKALRGKAGLTEGDQGAIRRILAAYVARHGVPGSERWTRVRQRQAHDAALPLHRDLAAVLADRLAPLTQDEGAAEEQLRATLQPVRGTAIPPRLVSKVMRAEAAPLATLVSKNLVKSGESMAQILPRITAAARAMAIAEPRLQALYGATYEAFRKRRSLLLLNFESQVKFAELPWIAAIAPWTESSVIAREAARYSLTEAATLAVKHFPESIIPNKLVKELRTLAATAGEPLVFVDELAVDIFMGDFGVQYQKAAEGAASLLGGSLYERYYGVPFQRVLSLGHHVGERYGTKVAAGFGRLCEELAHPGAGGARTAANGTVIEQGQVLTTHNLATLFAGLRLGETLRPSLPEMARQCFRWVCARHQLRIASWRARLHNVKNTAYAWRQMLFYLSLVDRAELGAFLAWSATHFEKQREDFRVRFGPVMAGLHAVAVGDTFGPDGRHVSSGGRRFLGWTTERHWLLPAERY